MVGALRCIICKIATSSERIMLRELESAYQIAKVTTCEKYFGSCSVRRKIAS